MNAHPNTVDTMPIIDAHVHVLDPATGLDPHRRYTPPAATPAMLSEHLCRIGARGVVITQASPHGSDNTALLHALAVLGRNRAVGIATMDAAGSFDDARRLADSGVAGLRINLPHEQLSAAVTHDRIATAARIARGAGLHLEVLLRPQDLPILTASFVLRCGVPFVLEHFGGLRTESWADPLLRQQVWELLDSEAVWIKLSRVEAIADASADSAALSMVQELTARRPDRLMWGSDWPHTPHAASVGDMTTVTPLRKVNDVQNLRAIRGVTTRATAAAVLHDTAASFYGFSSNISSARTHRNFGSR